MTKLNKKRCHESPGDVKKALKQHRGAMQEVARRSAVLLSTVSKVLDGLGTSANIAGHALDVLNEIVTTGSFARTEQRPRRAGKKTVREAMPKLRAKKTNGK